MTWKQAFTSSVGKKIVMAITGLSLILFLIVHVTVNACMWAVIFVPDDNGEVFNKAAHFLGQTLVPRVLEIGLFLFFFIHIIQGYVLEVQNRSKRGAPYAMNYGNRGSKWYSRSMGLLGTLIFLFLILHIYDFWIPSRFGGDANIHELEMVTYPDNPNHPYHNLYYEMIKVFQNGWIVIIYVLGCISLAYHLAHGFQSSFKTLGVYNKRYTLFLRGLGYAFAIIVSLVFALMPVSVYFGWVS
jgi:succinate dehydrogenase / fumarate reductase cytochrome b subunit